MEGPGEKELVKSEKKVGSSANRFQREKLMKSYPVTRKRSDIADRVTQGL